MMRSIQGRIASPWRRGTLASASLVLALSALVACSKAGEPVKITKADLSTKLNADNSISSASETFAPNAMVYGSVATEGSGAATLTAKWVSARCGCPSSR